MADLTINLDNASFLFKQGHNVHAPCLGGHGTKPKNLLNKTYLGWYESASHKLTTSHD